MYAHWRALASLRSMQVYHAFYGRTPAMQERLELEVLCTVHCQSRVWLRKGEDPVA